MAYIVKHIFLHLYQEHLAAINNYPQKKSLAKMICFVQCSKHGELVKMHADSYFQKHLAGCSYI